MPDFAMTRRALTQGLATCVLAAGAVASAWAQAQAPAAQAPEDRILVQTWAKTETVISSPMVGQLVRIPQRIGARFERGDTLLAFDCTENESRAQIAQSELTAASENLEAKIRLKAMDAASEIEVTVAAAQVAKAEAQLKLSQFQVSQCTVIAPFNGYVVRAMGKPYQTVTVGQPMLEVVSAGTPRLRLSASSKWFSRLRVGTPLDVRIDETGKVYRAVITSVNARIDPVNQSFEMEASLLKSEAGKLLPGMSGTAVLAERDDTAPADKPAKEKRKR